MCKPNESNPNDEQRVMEQRVNMLIEKLLLKPSLPNPPSMDEGRKQSLTNPPPFMEEGRIHDVSVFNSCLDIF